MKNKVVITKENYKEHLFKTDIILCWVFLLVCFIIKLFGGNFFHLMTDNANFIKFCEYVQNSFWYYVIGFISYFIIQLLIWCSMKRCKLRLTIKELIVVSLMTLILYTAQSLLCLWNPMVAALLITSIRYIIIPLFMLKASWKSVLIVNIADIIFQAVSSFIKNVDITETIANNVVVVMIFLIDYYIMLGLLYLYSYHSNKGGEEMGLFGGWFLGKKKAQKEAYDKLKGKKNEKAGENIKVVPEDKK